MLQNILKAFGLHADDYDIKPFGSGLINHTWKLYSPNQQYILQCINNNVFKTPQDIADNLVKLESYLHNTAPGYLFTAPLPTIDGQYLVADEDKYYRLSLFIQNSHTVNFITHSKQAYQAAKQFGKFTQLLKAFDTTKLKYTLSDFHNLSLRIQQFKTALANADTAKLNKADDAIKQVEANIGIAHMYEQLVNEQHIPLRVIHHDTKINNVLFNDDNAGLCVIDLDTVMPGYYISDVGDMMRTYLSAANEEEQDFSKIQIRDDYFLAIYDGYMQEMGNVLTPYEKNLFIYSGKFMIYMQGIRFLTDFLNGDIYYHTDYIEHNLKRAQNQFILLDRYIQSEDKFLEIINQLESRPTITFN
jgi:Ser/Thr protein kinase RdoA (MazF antagonist)